MLLGLYQKEICKRLVEDIDEKFLGGRVVQPKFQGGWGEVRNDIPDIRIKGSHIALLNDLFPN